MTKIRVALVLIEVTVCSLPTAIIIVPLWPWLWLGAAFDGRGPAVLLFASLFIGPVLGAITLIRYWILALRSRSSKPPAFSWYDLVALICGVAFFADLRLFTSSWFDPVVPAVTYGYLGVLVPSPAIAALLLAVSYLRFFWLQERHPTYLVAAVCVTVVLGSAAVWGPSQATRMEGSSIRIGGPASLTDGPAPLSWTEEVALSSGEVVLADRTFTEGRKIREQAISFVVDGRRIEWRLNQPPGAVMLYLPIVVDLVDGEPVIVYPVDHADPCKDFGYPPEGVVAFRLSNGQWSRTTIVDLPPDLRVNMLTSTHEIAHGHQYKEVTLQDKSHAEDRTASVKQGMLLSKVMRQYSNGEYSCAVMRPTPNPLHDTARDMIQTAEKNASVVKIEVIESSSVAQKLSAQDFAQNSGTRTNGGYVRQTCDGIVESLEPYYVWNERSGGGSNLGYRLMLTHSTTGLSSVPIAGWALDGSQSVACDVDTIYAAKRPDRRTLIVHRFTHGGDLIDAFSIDLTAIDESRLDNPRSTLWSIFPSADGSLMFTLATIEPNWILGQKVTFRVVLPPMQRPSAS